jgi:hypothetical protein
VAASGKKFIKIEGAKELRKALKQLGDKTARNQLGQEFKAEFAQAVAVVVSDAKSGSPHRTGRLSNSIRGQGSLAGGKVTVGGTKKVPYAAPIHWGWPTRPKKARGWRGGPIAPNPFLIRALDKNRAEIVRLMEPGVKRLLDEVHKVAAGG